MNGTMKLELIAEEYRAEMVGSFRKLADLVVEGRISPRQFLDGQRRIYDAYRIMSARRALVAMA